MIAAVDVRRVARLVLAAQDVGDDRRDPADDEAVSVDQVPFLLDLGRLGRLGRLPQRLHGVDPFGENAKGAANPRRRRPR
jgi:hypothetical protein